jgi:hypothetical protein
MMAIHEPPQGKKPEGPHRHLQPDELMVLVDDRIQACKASITDDIHEIRVFVDQINSAFVLDAAGQRDYTGHNHDHAARIAAARAEREFWETAKKEAIHGGVTWIMGAIKIVFLLALVGLAVKFGIVNTPPK